MYIYLNSQNTTTWIELEFRKVGLRENDGGEGKLEYQFQDKNLLEKGKESLQF